MGARAAAPRPWVGATVTAPTSRDGLLAATSDAVWRGDLAAAEVALTALADRERGRPDTALDFWSELLALLRCEPLGRAPRVGRGDPPLVDPWEQLRRLVQIERVRLGRARPEPPKTARVISRLDGQPGAARGVTEVVWPVEREHWSDELAVPVLVTHCEVAGAAPAVSAGWAPADDAEIALVTSTANGMPPGHPATGPLLLQSAVLEMARGHAAAALATLARLEGTGGVASREHDDAVFTAALASVFDPGISVTGPHVVSGVSSDLALAHARAAFGLDRPARRSPLAGAPAGGAARSRPSARTTRSRFSARRRTATMPLGATSLSARSRRTRAPAAVQSCSPRRVRRCTVTAAPRSTPIRRSAP